MEPVPVFFRGEPAKVLLRDIGQIRRMHDNGWPRVPDPLALGNCVSTPAGEGRYLFYDRHPYVDDETIPYIDRSWSVGMYRLDLTDLTYQRLPIEPLRSEGFDQVGVSDDGNRVVVSEGWHAHPYPPFVDEEGNELTPLTGTPEQRDAHKRAMRESHVSRLTHLDVRTGITRVFDSFTGGVGQGSDDGCGIQWSPDGTKLAIHLRFRKPENPLHEAIRIYDSATLTPIGDLNGHRLCGSLSWSTDSTRLLVLRNAVGIFDLTTGKVEKLPTFPHGTPMPPGNGQHRPLGFTPDDHLFTVTHRGKAMTLWSMHPHTGDTEPLARWSGELDLYPIMARMPDDYWA